MSNGSGYGGNNSGQFGGQYGGGYGQGFGRTGPGATYGQGFNPRTIMADNFRPDPAAEATRYNEGYAAADGSATPNPNEVRPAMTDPITYGGPIGNEERPAPAWTPPPTFAPPSGPMDNSGGGLINQPGWTPPPVNPGVQPGGVMGNPNFQGGSPVVRGVGSDGRWIADPFQNMIRQYIR